MTTLSELKSSLGEYAKDTKLNLGKVLDEDGSPGLTASQIFGTALASAYATKHPRLIEAIRNEAAPRIGEAHQQAARAAATIMGMNNVYYRFVHLVGGDYKTMPANLRMQVIANPGIEKVDFELYSLAVSAINGCGMCMEAHVHEVTKGGVAKEGVQSAIRIAAVLSAAAQALVIGETENEALQEQEAA